jgi:large subunit ribosomal protein L24
MPRHVCKGDTVIVTAGNDKGTVGEVIRVIPADDRVVVQGVNVRSKHIKPSQRNPQGGIIQKEMPIHWSNVSPVVDGKPSRVRFQTADDGAKTRVAVRDDKTLHTLRKSKRKDTPKK